MKQPTEEAVSSASTKISYRLTFEDGNDGANHVC
jgi:hypothetical protein